MFCDYHVHTEMSTDSQTPLAEQVAQAYRLGLKEICLAEHLEINFPDGRNWRIDVQDYVSRYRAVKSNGVRVKLGVEAGIACLPEDLPTLEADLRSVELDFVLASCHLVNRMDPYKPEFYEGRTIEESFSAYIGAILEHLRKIDPSLYCVVAHIDYPSKGSNAYPDPRLFYAYAPDEIDALFRYIIPLGKGIEINTSAYRKLGSLPYPGLDWLKRYVELGGEFVTIGSDAHTPQHVAFELDAAADLARAAGVKYFATFDRMVPEFHRLQ